MIMFMKGTQSAWFMADIIGRVVWFDYRPILDAVLVLRSFDEL